MSRALLVLSAVFFTTAASAQALAFRPAGQATAQAVIQTPEQRIALLEKRIAAFEARFNVHTHEYQHWAVGLLEEPINGRRIPLAINPRSEKTRTAPPQPAAAGSAPPAPAPAPAPIPAPKPGLQIVARTPLPLTPEQRIAQLEKTIAALETRYGTHTHEFSHWAVGLLSEPINGRRITLAINPRIEKPRTGPPQP